MTEPDAVGLDHLDGGRWTSLWLAGREWLWAGPGLLTGPRAGHSSFTDAGGLDECFPTVRGTPDHGGLWNLGVEPMLGRVFDLAEAGPGDAAVVPASGELAWRLTVSARPV